MLKKYIPEGIPFFREKEKENFIDQKDGVHVIFGMIVVPYIFYIIENKKTHEINKIFSFLEDMANCEDVEVKEVLDFTILEQLVDRGYDTLEQCKKYMGINTLKHCEEIEKYFFIT